MLARNIILSMAAAMLTMGVSGMATAQTDVLVNGDAEAAIGTEWTAVDGADRLTGLPFPEEHVLVGPHGGDWLFSMGIFEAGDQLGNTASLMQTVDVSGCNLNINGVDLQGTWTQSGWYATQVGGNDFGTATVEIYNGVPALLSTDTNTNLISVDAWAEVTDSGNLPVGADTADITIAGTVPADTGVQADVVWDDVTFIINCVESSAKISGKFASDGKRPTHVFGGAVGLLEGGETAAGTLITVSYKKSAGFTQNTACTFVEGTGTTAIVGDTATLTDWSYTCDDGRDTSGETADIILVDRSTDAPRGSIDVEADDSQLNVNGLLKRGNVIVADGT